MVKEQYTQDIRHWTALAVMAQEYSERQKDLGLSSLVYTGILGVSVGNISSDRIYWASSMFLRTTFTTHCVKGYDRS